MSDTTSATEKPTAPKSPQQRKERNASLLADAFRQLRRRPTVILPVIVLLTVGSMAVFPKLWTDEDPRRCLIGRSQGSPEWPEHPFGFNVLGCDYYAHAIYGARPSLVIAVVSTIGIVVVGAIFGMLAGFFGGWVDAIISRIMDIFFGLPFLLGAIVFLSIFQDRSEVTIIAILVILGWTTIARLMRGSVIASKNLDYVQAARSLGASDGRLMFKHILPNAVAPVVVYATIGLGAFVSAEATLSFLGVGLIPPAISWGVMIDSSREYFAQNPMLMIYPVLFVIATVLSTILLGDALRDALDPKMQ